MAKAAAFYTDAVFLASSGAGLLRCTPGSAPKGYDSILRARKWRKSGKEDRHYFSG